MLNKAVIQGRLTRDPELRKTQSGTSVASFTVAWSEEYNNGNNKKLFLNCVAWKATAEMVKRNLCKGKEILVEGSLGSRSWEDRDGNKREVVELTADRIHFCGPKQESTYSEPIAPSASFEELSEDDGDLPF